MLLNILFDFAIGYVSILTVTFLWNFLSTCPQIYWFVEPWSADHGWIFGKGFWQFHDMISFLRVIWCNTCCSCDRLFDVSHCKNLSFFFSETFKITALYVPLIMVFGTMKKLVNNDLITFFVNMLSTMMLSD